MKLTLEIRPAEGGDDSKSFCHDLASTYVKMAGKLGWTTRLVVHGTEIHIEFQGTDLSELKKEAGGHRVQRIPGNERKGRVHSSTVTVAVIEATKPKEAVLLDKDLKIEWYSGTGAGGQHRNKHQNSARITHLPTGEVATAQTRSRESSLVSAKEALVSRLNELGLEKNRNDLSSTRKSQMGSGMRGDKIRTYQMQHDIATDHRTGVKVSASRALDGNINELW